ncbi:MAG: NAD(P)-dependent oxidoreductase [bacterium]|nr:NAD(P)-dependent oxidoreductase [bacterium]
MSGNDTAQRVLVTGGSGFIGTNLIEAYLRDSVAVASTDAKPPRHPDHGGLHTQADLLDYPALKRAFDEFSPTQVVHLAARTDLFEKNDIAGYAANTTGTENVVRAVAETASVKRCIFTSTKLVCKNGYYPSAPDEYGPVTLYGESKALSEKIIKQDTSMSAEWCIVRPGSIWGPWFEAPYRDFFVTVSRGRYFNIGSTDTPKIFGYVGNVVHQLRSLLAAPAADFHRQVYYLSDYESILISNWAELIRGKLDGPRIRRIPEFVVRVAAFGGDCLKAVGYGHPPISSFRLNNMRTDTSGMPLDRLQGITGPLPFTLEQACDETIAWLREQKLIA